VASALETTADANDLSFITLLHPDWEFPSDGQNCPPVEDLVRLMKSQLAATNLKSSLMFVDVTFVRMASRQQRICFHLHGLGWGKRDHVDRALGAWPQSFCGAPGKTTKAIYNLSGVLAYCAKDTRTRSVVKRSGTRNWHHKERIWSPQMRTLLHLLGSTSKPLLTFATGEGTAVLKRARRLAREIGWKQPSK
jgi:hypothetical protein